MGMYTELVLKCGIKAGKNRELEEVLNFLFNGKELPTSLPNHPFFDTDRWRQVGSNSSFYHIPQAFSFYEGGYLFTRTDLKNYDSEIYKFLDWISPYIERTPDVIGWVWHEEWEEPKIIRVSELSEFFRI